MCVIQNKQNTGQNELYAGTDVGVYVKSGTAVWTPFMTGLPNVLVPELEIYYDNTSPGNSKLRAATFGRGLWESDLLTSTATWNGTVSSNWNTAANWTPAVVPSGATDVIIPATAASWPTYTGNFSLGSQCKNLTMNGLSELTVTGNLTSPSGFTLTNNANAIIHVSGDWNNTGGTFVPGSGLVDFYGTNNAVINPSPAGPAYLINEDFSTWPGSWSGDIGTGNGKFSQNSTSNAGGTSPEAMYKWQSATTTNQMIHNPVNTSGLTSMTLDFKHMVDDYSGSGYTIKVQYSTDGITWTDVWSVSPTGNINATSVSLALTATEGSGYATYYISFTRTGNLYNINYWYIDDVQLYYNTIGTETFNNVTISKANALVSTNGNVDVQQDFTVKPGAYFTNSSGNIFNVLGNAIFEADASGMASFIDDGTTTVSGITTVQQYLTADVWHLVSSPVAGSSITPYNDVYLSSFQESTGSWTGLVNPALPMHTAAGYAAQATTGYTGPTTILFTGPLQKSDYYIDTLSYTSSQTYSGFSLLGNPYPSSLDWNNSWSMTNFSGWMEVWDNGTYRGWHTSGTSYNGKTNGTIPPGQGFWVRTSNATNNITIPAAQRVHSAQSFYKQTSDFEFPIIRLQSTINGYTDETGVIFHPESTTGFDSYFDLTKFTNVEDAPQLYSITGGEDYAMNFYGDNYLGEIIPIGFTTASSGVYTISASEIMNFDEGTFVWLEDLKTGEFSQLYEGMNYSFAYETIDDPHRFNLHFTNTILGVDGTTTNPIRIWSFKHILYFDNPSEERTHAEVFDILGKKIFDSSDIYSGVNQINLNVLPGYYLVKITSGENTQTAKVLLK